MVKHICLCLLLAGCSDGLVDNTTTDLRPASIGPSDPSVAINPYFRFMPPLLTEARALARQDLRIAGQTAVEVCEVRATSCGAIARFSVGNASGPLQVDSLQFAAQWHVPPGAAGKSFLVRVILEENELGRIAVRVVVDRAALDLGDQSAVRIVAGKTLPIKFRIEEGAVHEASPQGSTVTGGGGNVQLVIPAEAVSKAVAVTIVPVAAPSSPTVVPGTVYEMGPHGIVFTKPVRMTIKYNPALLPAGVSARTLRLLTRVGDRWQAVANSSVDTIHATVAGDLAGFSQKAAGPTPLSVAIDQLHQAIAAFNAEDDPEKATALVTNVAGLAEFLEDPSFATEMDRFNDQAGTTACDRFQDVTAAARRFVSVDNLTAAVKLMRGLFGWNTILSALGTDCRDLANHPIDYAAETLDLTQSITKELAVKFDLEATKAKDEPFAFSQLLAQLDTVEVVAEQARDLTLDEEYTLLAERIMLPIGDKLRAAAYSRCQLKSDLDYFKQLLPYAGRGLVSYSASDLRDDVQYCGTQISWRVVNTEGGLMSSGTLGGGGLPGTALSEAVTQGFSKGTLVIDGPIDALHCATGNSDDRLTVTGGMAIYSDSAPASGKFLTTESSGDLQRMLAAARIDPTKTDTLEIQFRRSSSGCGVLTASATDQYLLAVIKLAYPEPQLEIIPAVATLQVGASQRFLARMKGSTKGVTWTASVGQIDSTGVYEARVPDTTVIITATSKEFPAIRATARVTIPDVQVTITPTGARIQTGTTQQFTAQVTGTASTGVLWTASRGSITANGLYTAPSRGGTYQVMATSAIAPSRSKTVSIIVDSVPPLPLYTLTIGSCSLSAVAYAGALSQDRFNRDSEADPTCGNRALYSRTVSASASAAESYASGEGSASSTLSLAQDDAVTVSASGTSSASASTSNPDTSFVNRNNSSAGGGSSTRADMGLELVASGGRSLHVEVTGSATVACWDGASFVIGNGTLARPQGLLINKVIRCDDNTWSITFAVPAGQSVYIMHELHSSMGAAATTANRNPSGSWTASLNYEMRIREE